MDGGEWAQGGWQEARASARKRKKKNIQAHRQAAGGVFGLAHPGHQQVVAMRPHGQQPQQRMDGALARL